jgi:hypothetical protein
MQKSAASSLIEYEVRAPPRNVRPQTDGNGGLEMDDANRHMRIGRALAADDRKEATVTSLMGDLVLGPPGLSASSWMLSSWTLGLIGPDGIGGLP